MLAHALPSELLARVLDIVAADDPKALLVLRRTCTRWKAAIEQAPERWKQACIKSHLLFYNNTSKCILNSVAGGGGSMTFGQNGGRRQCIPGVGGSGCGGAAWMWWYVSQSKLLRAWEKGKPDRYASCDTSTVAGGALRVKIASNGLVYSGHLDGTVRVRALNNLASFRIGGSVELEAAAANNGSAGGGGGGGGKQEEVGASDADAGTRSSSVTLLSKTASQPAPGAEDDDAEIGGEEEAPHRHPFVGAVVSLTLQETATTAAESCRGIVWTGCMDQSITAWRPSVEDATLVPVKRMLGHEGGVITLANKNEWVSWCGAWYAQPISPLITLSTRLSPLLRRYPVRTRAHARTHTHAHAHARTHMPTSICLAWRSTKSRCGSVLAPAIDLVFNHFLLF